MIRRLLISTACLALTAGAAPALAQSAAPQTTAFSLDTGRARTAEQLALRFDKADLSFRIHPDTKTIDSVAVLDFTATAPVRAVVVELDTALPVSAVSVDGQALNPRQWSNPEGRLTIRLPRTLATGRSVQVRIAYDGSPRQAPRAPWDGGFVWATTPDGKPWIATAVQGEGCDLFWPCIDHPQGEPGRVDLHITVPSDLSAPSNGRFVGKEDHGDGWTTWNWTTRDPDTYAITLAVGPYVELTDEYASRFGDRFPMHFWPLASSDPERTRALFAQFAPMLDFYEATVGPYPFRDEKMGVVETPHLGMEHQTINAYGNGYALDGKGYDWLLQHELAHEWFGNQLTNADWDDMWLHEGFGSYMQPLYARWLNGDRAMETELQAMRLRLINRFPVVSGRSQTAGQVYEEATGPGLDLYYKGALIAHSLRLLIGDEAFWSAVRTSVYGRPDPRPGNFTPRYGTTPEFIANAEAASGRDLGWFFDAYLYTAGLPDLQMTRDGDRVTLEWVTPSGKPFPMPVEVEVDGQVQTLAMEGGRGELTAPAGAHILLDPRNRVLRRLAHIEEFQERQRQDAAARRAASR
ncbi:MAG TPA: M1 family metallopeptidase [Brevundimonas sp.]|uniref:M1 family metallopeptidase n=1 Tax=Brevundimonas sp. TaxID=1871086 RepID=UPI0026197763|nr:M1 family metallopeptidase [Brevundimonas sp.]HRO32599.1 M1 family metallopeptidase [Brevundimonas sp.]